MCVFLVLIYFTEVKWLIPKKTIIFKVPEGVQHFPGEPNFFQGGAGPIAYSLLKPILLVIFQRGPDPLSPSGSALEATTQKGI